MRVAVAVLGLITLFISGCAGRSTQDVSLEGVRIGMTVKDLQQLQTGMLPNHICEECKKFSCEHNKRSSDAKEPRLHLYKHKNVDITVDTSQDPPVVSDIQARANLSKEPFHFEVKGEKFVSSDFTPELLTKESLLGKPRATGRTSAEWLFSDGVVLFVHERTPDGGGDIVCRVTKLGSK